MHTTREQMLNPRVRDIPEFKLRKELAALKGRSVLLCFTCDPYQPLDVTEAVTRRTIQLLHEYRVKAVVLTKGGSRSARDFDLLSTRPDLSAYGATLTFVSAKDSAEWEPGAAPPSDRMRALKRAHNLGIPTWASLEPVVDPKQSLEIIRRTHEYVDTYKIGKWNYDKRANTIDWAAFATSAVTLLRSLGKEYYIKQDLAVFLPRGLKKAAKLTT
jgi:DNA repair photolyase